ncbi:MAG: hypothetical protein ACRDO1_10750 [Nocardioidaceae bacterium]
MTTPRPAGRRQRRLPLLLAGLLAVAALGVGGYVLLGSGAGVLREPERCLAHVDGRTVALDLDQAANAAIIAGVAVERGLPARAVTIALATAYQESKIRNLDHGDRDSLGLFQQRPSQGWGTAEQVRDAHYAAGRFYDALVKIDGYRDLEITAAAQRVQRSAFGTAYADHEPDARVLASALTGYSPAGLTCVVRHDGVAVEQPGERGLTPRADAVLRDLEATFGQQTVGGFAPGGVTDGHAEGSAHYDGRAVDVFFRPVSEAQRRAGWAQAQYLVSRAKALGIQTVIFDDRIWTARRSESGWRAYQEPSGGDAEVLQHRDHVHVDVLSGS